MRHIEAMALRELLHSGETAARDLRIELIRDKTRNDGITVHEIERERDLASVACVALWEVRSEEAHRARRARRKLISCLRRLAMISISRWIGALALALKIFSPNALTPRAG